MTDAAPTPENTDAKTADLDAQTQSFASSSQPITSDQVEEASFIDGDLTDSQMPDGGSA